jgi:copper type II ascorbate-dependent monooxygenase-like protein
MEIRRADGVKGLFTVLWLLVVALVLSACSAHGGEKSTSGSPNSAGSDASAGSAGSSQDTGLAAEDTGVPANAKQYTFTIDAFDVPAGAERYECQDVPNPFDKDIAIIKTESNMSAGAHHMFAFQIPATEAAFTPDAGLYAAEFPSTPPDGGGVVQTFTPDGGKTPLFDCPAGGLEFHSFFIFVQKAQDSEIYPDGIGRSLNASEAIRLNVHYLNTSAAPIHVTADATVTYVDATAVTQTAVGIFGLASSLKVPNGISTQTFSYKLPTDMNFLQFMGHMHQRGTYFEARAIDGATGAVRSMYSSNTWNEPPTLNYAPAFEMKSGDTLWYSCTFDNQTGGVLTFGESASTNEMCNFFGVFYPAANSNSVVAQF